MSFANSLQIKSVKCGIIGTSQWMRLIEVLDEGLSQ